MATIPKERRETVLKYKGGSVQATYGILKFLFPNIKFVWKRPEGLTPRGRRKSWGHVMATTADPGQVIKVHTVDGDVWQCRITGTPLDFLNAIMDGRDDEKIAAIYTERGEKYAPEAEIDNIPVLPG